MVMTKESEESANKITSSTKRRIRRNRLKFALTNTQNIDNKSTNLLVNISNTKSVDSNKNLINHTIVEQVQVFPVNKEKTEVMSANDNKSREDVMAARQAKKLGKQKGKDPSQNKKEQIVESAATPKNELPIDTKCEKEFKKEPTASSPKGKDEVDKASVKVEEIGDAGDKNKEQIKAERAAKKAAKQAKKKGTADGSEVPQPEKPLDKPIEKPVQPLEKNVSSKPVNEDMTVKDVVETLREIVNVAKEIKDVTVKVNAIDLSGKKEKAEESGKSKAELKAERRAKQEAQRASKQAAEKQKVAAKPEAKKIPETDVPKVKEEKPAKPKADKIKAKSQASHRVNWFQHLYKDQDKDTLKSTAINSNLHPAIIKLGVQLSSRVVTGSNARCIALLDALKKMVRDYTLPAKTEFARGLESHLTTSLDYLWAMRPPSASQMNAVKFFRYHLTQMANNVDEFDAKKTLAEEIDRYIREQIDMAGEAISIAVRNKISNGDNILTYGYSSLIERILVDAWSSGLSFRTVVVGDRVRGTATQMLRRLVARGLPCTYVDITALGMVMKTASKVVLGAGALLANGSVLGAAGTAPVALAARARNVPVLVACETHKFSANVQTDAFVYNEIGDPDDLIDKSDDNSPLKDWRSNPNLTPLNLTYDVTPASLVTAVVTELAILPCTSAPVVLRFKLSEYSV